MAHRLDRLMPEITLDKRYNNAAVKIGSVTHLTFKVDHYRGLQTWVTADRWCIELYLDGATIRTEYDSAAKFVAVLACIEQAIED